jgi:imidazolonepropionase
MSELGIIPRGEVLVLDGKIAAVGPKVDAPSEATSLDAAGRVLMPGLVDCHTHACYVADRVEDWTLLAQGTTRAAVSQKGGGGGAVMRSIQDATMKQLAAGLRERLSRMLREGTTTVEVKSGYGLNAAAELKMLRAIVRAGQDWPGTVVPTALLGHPVEGRNDEGDKAAAREMLHEISQEFPEVAVDAWVDDGGWSIDTALRLFEKAAKHHPIRVHSDEIKPLGMIAEAIRLHARSVDHLDAATKADLQALAAAPATCGVILPCASLNGSGRYARAGFIVDQGGAVALGTDCNPVSSQTLSMPFAIALAVRFCGLSPAEAIVAATINGAAVLGLKDRGTVEPGQRADLIILRHTDERQLAFEWGGGAVESVIAGGTMQS